MSKNNMVTSEDTHYAPSRYPKGNTRRYLPEVRVSFHTETKCYQAKGRVLNRGEERDPTYQLLSVSTVKTLSSPSGSFTLTLAGDQWESRLLPNDMVIIRMGYIGETIPTVMVGLIDRIKVSRSSQGGIPSVTTTVGGRDFGKALIKAMLKFYPEIGGTKTSSDKFFLTQVGWIKMLGIFTEQEMVQGTPDVILSKIMTTVFPKLNNTLWTVYDEKQANPTPRKMGVTNLISWDFEKTDFFVPFYLTADTFEGSIWNLMERATQRPFTELFIDTYSPNAVPKSVATPTTTTKTVTTTSKVDKYHTVVKNDTLWHLAGRYYKNNLRWREIWEANKTMMIARDKRNSYMHGHWIYPGQKLRIPGVTTTTTSQVVVQTPPSSSNHSVPLGLENGKISITYRMAPFDLTRWNKLRISLVEAVDIINEDLQRSDDEHYNVFWSGSSLNALGDINIKSVSPPIMNEADTKRYGLSPLEVEFEGLAIDRTNPSKHKVALENLSNKYSKILKAWYENNHKYYSGSLYLRGNPHIRIGERIEYAPKGLEMYVEGVNQDFNVFTEWATTLTVTRGILKANKNKELKDTINNTTKTTTTPTTTATKDVYHTVVKNDTLWHLAGKYYKNNLKWRVIWEANKTMLIARDKRNATNHGHWIYPGQKLRIPK